MKQGSYQVEMSDEGLMTQDIEECLRVVLQALKKCDLPPDEVVAWYARNDPERPCGMHLRSGSLRRLRSAPLQGITVAITRPPGFHVKSVRAVCRKRPGSLPRPAIADHDRTASKDFSRLPEGHEAFHMRNKTVVDHLNCLQFSDRVRRSE